MQRHVLSIASLALFAGLGHAAEGNVKSTPASIRSALASGIDARYIERSIRPQDDFFEYLNGKWLKTVDIPSDKPYLDPFVDRYEDSLRQLREIIEKAGAGTDATHERDARRIGDFYASFMDEAKLEQLGITPLRRELDRIAAIQDKAELSGVLAHLGRLGMGVPLDFTIHLDNKDSTRYVADISQGGLGLPDPDYFLKADDRKLADMKTRYLAHCQKVLSMAGDGHAAAHAQAIVAFETELAKAQWTKVELRDPNKAYNKFDLSDLPRLAPGFDWNGWLDGIGLSGKSTYVIVGQPSYLKAFAGIANVTPLDTWKAYLTLHLVKSYSRFLSKSFVDADFEFFDKTLFGIEANEPRWKRGVGVIESTQGDALGRLYVARYFPQERKVRIERLMRNLLATYKLSIDKLDWMSPATKREAQAKLAKMKTKIGYPDKWKDYSALIVKRDDLVGNVMRSRELEFDRDLAKLGKPIDRDEWTMTPQTVNAYYNPEKNEIVVPAAVLQPPFFDGDADDAVNYGGIGTILGHEISHGFDDQGSQYDGNGNLRDWWTAADHKRFKEKSRMLVSQYNAFEAIPGYHVNGELTLGENIADISGLAIAYKAYHMSLKGTTPPMIGGLTGDQRLYMGFGQIWRQKMRDNMLIMVLKTDPHSPGRFRTNGPLRNNPGFYDTFGVKPGDKMYLAPRDRVSIW
jgi:predicted metalloendopeptidase